MILLEHGKVQQGKTITAQMDEWFLSSTGEAHPTGTIYPFSIRAVVYVNKAPRADTFEWFLDAGSTVIEKLFEGHEPTADESLFFCFPERWMTPKEARKFLKLLGAIEIAKTGVLKRVDIFTQSPIIIGEIEARNIVIIE